MANTQAARLSFTVRDALGTETSITEYAMVDPAITGTQLAALWQSQALLLDAMIDGQIVRGSVNVVMQMAGGKAEPEADSRAEQTGVFGFANAITANRYGIAVASIADAVIAGGRIDVVEGGVVDLWADSQVAGIAGGGVFTNPSQQANTALVTAVLSFRKRGQLARTSRERVTT